MSYLSGLARKLRLVLIFIGLTGCLDLNDSSSKGISWVSLCGIENVEPQASQTGYGIEERPSNECLNVSANTGLLSNIVVEAAYPNLSFDRPVDLAKVPGTDYAVVVEHKGNVEIFRDEASVQLSSTFLNLSFQVDFDNSEQGLVKLTFDPNYEENGYFYVSYAGDPEVVGEECEGRCSVISRFKRNDNDELVADIDSEEIVLIIPQFMLWHNADNLYFGPKGYLYVGIGDGGFGSEINAQDRTNFLGSILRIDVSQGLPYRIPSDNPFFDETIEVEGVVGEGNPIRKEIWAYGFRNPHRFSIDSVTDRMIVADVGYYRQEEINIVSPGDNFGWNIFEGSLPESSDHYGRNPDDMKEPIFEYDHDTGQSITGGYVYRGTGLPSLFGRYIYGDFVAGTIWAFDINELGMAENNIVIANAGGLSISSFASFDEEIYLTNLSAGTVQKLSSANNDGQVGAPDTLSETGIFDSLLPLIPAPGSIPYDVNAPLWSDGATKSRWMIIPDGQTIQFDESGSWIFPEGTVLVKHFSLDLDTTTAKNTLRNLETRMLVNTTRGWIGYTYRWDEAQTEAYLLTVSEYEDFIIKTDGGQVTQSYYFPSTGDCSICHNPTEGYVLGLRTAQLNGDFNYNGFIDNQLRALDHIELFNEALALPMVNGHVYKDLNNEGASLEERSRSYLASNCSHCHNADAALPTPLDFRFGGEAAVLNAIDLVPQDNLGITSAKVIDPGSKETSVLWLRMKLTDGKRMPPLATHVVDAQAIDVIGQWIDSL